MPRLPYQFPRERLLPKHLHKCTKYTSLCPACRTFGWVHEDAAELPPTTRTAYAGRLSISHALCVHKVGSFDATLAILSTPKPTTTQFYLFGATGNPDPRADYDNPRARLRGRKFYRHHGDKPSQYFSQQFQEYRNEYERVAGSKDDQNRTVRGALDAGARFSFTLDFENLASAELGALLWSLELEDRMYHRLGYGKPLGFGSVTIRVTDLRVMQPKQRYATLAGANSGWIKVERQRYEDWITAFKEQMQTCYHKSFDQLENIRDLKQLLSAPSNVHVHYPRRGVEPSPEGKNFEWFVRNKRRQGEPLTLSSTENEIDLPLDPS